MNTSETKFFSRKCYLLKKLSVNFFSEIILEIMKMNPHPPPWDGFGRR